MSSRIVPRDSPGVVAAPWRRAGELDAPPPHNSYPAVSPEEESVQLRASLASLEQRLAASARAGQDREARAFASGRQEGYAAGCRDGAASVQAEAAQTLAAVQAEASNRVSGAAAQAVDLRRRLRQQMEADLVRLAVAIARRILRRELAVDPDALMGIVKSAVERIAARELMAIRVSPGDGPRVSLHLAGLHLPDRVEVREDSALAWGSVVFDTTRGQHDASVETQIKEIDRGLADLVGRPS